jgi:preprotein translocase subunit SecG
MTKATAAIAVMFFLTCLALAYLSSHRSAPQSITGSVTEQQVQVAPEPAAELPPAGAGSADAQESDLPPAE